MTRIHNPPHPGETLREDVLPALAVTVTEAATQLGVTRAALSRVPNGRAAASLFCKAARLYCFVTVKVPLRPICLSRVWYLHPRGIVRHYQYSRLSNIHLLLVVGSE